MEVEAALERMAARVAQQNDPAYRPMATRRNESLAYQAARRPALRRGRAAERLHRAAAPPLPSQGEGRRSDPRRRGPPPDALPHHLEGALATHSVRAAQTTAAGSPVERPQLEAARSAAARCSAWRRQHREAASPPRSSQCGRLAAPAGASWPSADGQWCGLAGARRRRLRKLVCDPA